MNKIPSLFLRDPEDMHWLTRQVNPLCQWVIDGGGVATRKYDGTCVMLDEEGGWWARREVKPGKIPPLNWRPVETDDITGKSMGWEPIEQSGYYRFWEEAYELGRWATVGEPGTYELCGPKIGGNPEGYDSHVLIRHADAEVLTLPMSAEPGVTPPTFDDIRTLVQMLRLDHGWEGIVWHHPDGRMAKIKARDFKQVREETS